jgi:hypothetical protein
VGTFYSAASPEDPPFVSVGSVVKADTVICIIEAMKILNQIEADKSGKIKQIHQHFVAVSALRGNPCVDALQNTLHVKTPIYSQQAGH